MYEAHVMFIRYISFSFINAKSDAAAAVVVSQPMLCINADGAKMIRNALFENFVLVSTDNRNPG